MLRRQYRRCFQESNVFLIIIIRQLTILRCVIIFKIQKIATRSNAVDYLYYTQWWCVFSPSLLHPPPPLLLLRPHACLLVFASLLCWLYARTHIISILLLLLPLLLLLLLHHHHQSGERAIFGRRENERASTVATSFFCFQYNAISTKLLSTQCAVVPTVYCSLSSVRNENNYSEQRNLKVMQ